MTEPSEDRPQRLHLAIDFDDVICSFVEGVCETVSRDFDVDVRPEDVTSWRFGDYLDHHIGRSWWAWLEDHAPLWGEKFKPVRGALGTMERLRAQGHLLEIVTAKPRWAEQPFWNWLARYGTSAQRVTVLGMGETKVGATDADVLIDDKFESCREFAADGRVALLYSAAHNRGRELDPGMYRVNDWHQVEKLIQIEAEEGLA